MIKPLSHDNRLNVLSRVQKAWGDSPFFQAKLRGPAPDRLLFQADDPYTPDQAAAEALMAGRLSAGEEAIDCQGELSRIWDLAKPGGAAFAFLQEFSWLRHLNGAGAKGRDAAALMLKGWLDRNEKWSADTWRAHLIAERLMMLCAYHPLVLDGRDALWRSRILSAMARQTRHLGNSAHRAETGFDRLMASLALTLAGHCLPGCEAAAARGLELARRELRLQLRADGGHVSRNPSRQLRVALRIQAAQRGIEARGLQPPGFLKHANLRASVMASFFRTADGGLAVFNGGVEDDKRAVLANEKALDPESAPAAFARHSGYQKLSSGRALIIMDTGAEKDAKAIRGAGSLHFSSGTSRIFGNCGNGMHLDDQWRAALARREAHSTLSFDDSDSGGSISFEGVVSRGAEDAQGALIEFERQLMDADRGDGTWMRRIFIAAGGADLRGEERLSGISSACAARAVWRFHLHPGVKASLARDRKSVLLLLPNREGWRFKSNAQSLSLEKTVYTGVWGQPAAAEQIVLRVTELTPRADGDVIAKWGLRRTDAV